MSLASISGRRTTARSAEVAPPALAVDLRPDPAGRRTAGDEPREVSTFWPFNRVRRPAGVAHDRRVAVLDPEPL